MYLRPLKPEDAPLMLEWMQDKELVSNLSTDFSNKTIDDCLDFIRESEDSSKNLHMAIASDSDEYMGTVSLKNIDREASNAEFAIATRKLSAGKGYAWEGMTGMLKIAFEDLQLECVYWGVANDNLKALRFCEKHGFNEIVDLSQSTFRRYENMSGLHWYSVLAGDDYENIALSRGTVAGCRVVDIRTVPTLGAGELSFFEGESDVPFDIKRIYYISKVPEGTRRGFHAHKKLKQLLFCPYGKIQLILDNGNVREEINLSDPSIGIVIEGSVWREMLWLQKDSVLCVAASEHYDPEDYIRDYNEFLKFKKV